MMFLAAPLAFAASIHTNFEGGSLGRIEKVTNAHFRLGSAGEKDQDGRNRQANWYYFRVDAAPRAEMTLDIVDLPGEYNYKPNRGAITKDTPPVISYDGKTWRHVETFEYDAVEPKLRLRVNPAKGSFWIAHTPPYTAKDLAGIPAHADLRREVVGKTLGGREMLLWTITKGPAAGKKTIWLMFRQHSWESGSSWVGEGAVRALLADASLRERFVWKIFPLCDPDGVARGGVRFNAKGFDLNRNWDVTDEVRMPEITTQRAAVKAWIAAGHSVDLFLSLHNTETAEYLEGSPAAREIGARLFGLLGDKTSFAPSLKFFLAPETTTAGMPGRMTVTQGLQRDFKIPGLLMEQRVSMNAKLGHLPEIGDRLKFGGELVRAMAEALLP